MIRHATSLETFLGSADPTSAAASLSQATASRNAFAIRPDAPVLKFGEEGKIAEFGEDGERGTASTSAVASLMADSAQSAKEDLLAIEAEIANLTWAVLDGKASLEDRRRLAQLVSAQHQRRS